MDIIIDASRNRSGGAVAHILGILNSDIDPNNYGINKVYICSYNRLLDRIEDKPWLIKVNHNLMGFLVNEGDKLIEFKYERELLREKLKRILL